MKRAKQSKTPVEKRVKIPESIRSKMGWVRIKLCKNLLESVCEKAAKENLRPHRLMSEVIWEYSGFGSPYELQKKIDSLKAARFNAKENPVLNYGLCELSPNLQKQISQADLTLLEIKELATTYREWARQLRVYVARSRATTQRN